jgi:hypothetical protein
MEKEIHINIWKAPILSKRQCNMILGNVNFTLSLRSIIYKHLVGSHGRNFTAS